MTEPKSAEDMTEKWKSITIVCRDEENSLENLLTYIKQTAGIGHSFNVHVDPEDREFSNWFSIDGDGADKIYSITTSTVPKPLTLRNTAIAAIEGAAIALRQGGMDEHAAIILGLQAAAEMLRAQATQTTLEN